MRLWCGLVLAFCVSGCARSHGPYSPRAAGARDSIRAQKLTQEAGEQSDPVKAERLLREALSADIFHGPAHNNLGVIFLKRGELFEAAQEFQWAKKTMPGHPDPRMNLALTLEKAGKTDEALTAYASALEVYKDHMPTVQAMTRLRVRTGKSDESVKPMLEQIALQGETEQWRDWARRQLNRRER